MNNFFISIVSHGHDDYIINNKNILDISKIDNVTVLIKDNVKSDRLRNFCNNNNLHYLFSENPIGFGENNNDLFDFCQSIAVTDKNWFLVINPDVIIDLDNFERLISELNFQSGGIYTVNLYKDSDFSISEDSLRYFPSFDGVLNFALGKQVTKPYKKDELINLSGVEWASGAFLVFDFDTYKVLEGFDKRYFMYYEDVDICFRAKIKLNENVKFLKDVKAVHSGAYRNRKLFSKHFFWYSLSMVKFMMLKKWKY
ncbi:glycosyltransferase family 2 protein [Vibrio tasmaniensis]|uniref:glycosyltransferase family 2 protein n=1 Tax=Vibrio tasmaniensis TaxID=212663 RepID=UPI00108082EA|nr:glycosyltransferase family 2 protein [Vibrio tasmaniensis]